MNEPLFSLALPIKNGLPGLRRTVAALQLQTFQDFELIVQDCVSSDGSLDYLQRAGLPMVDIVSEADSGIGQAYNRAFRRCRGKLLVALACDEWLENNALETFASWYGQHPDAAYVYGGCRLWKSETELHSVLYPGPYDFLKFLTGEYAPTTGGFFNKAIIGPDLYLDETLVTCPDFDLFIRLGLRFGAREIVEKRAILFNAFSNRTSRSYRAELYDQIANDRRHILDRLFDAQGNSPIGGYLRNFCVSSMHGRLASALLQLTGETPRVHAFIREAARHHPGSPAVAELAARTRGLTLDEATGEVVSRGILQPEQPLSCARRAEAAVVSLEPVESTADWQGYGAEASFCDAGISITTGPDAWSYAAQIPLNSTEAMDDRSWYWVRLVMDVMRGQIGVSIVTPTGALRGERLFECSNQTELSLPLLATDIAILFRNGAIGGQTVIRLRAAEVLYLPIPPDYSLEAVPRGC